MDKRQSDQYARNVPVVPDTDSVDSDLIKDGAVTEPKLADGAVSIRAMADGAVTNAKLRISNALSVIGRSVNTNGTPADIALDTNGKFLVRRANQLVGDTIVDGDLPASIARDVEVTSAISAAITAHEGASDPHPGYLTQTEGDARYLLQSNVLGGSATYDPPNLADGTAANTTVTVSGAALGDFALASFSLSLQGIAISAAVTAADTVTVVLSNQTGGALDISSGTLRARVWKQ